MMAWKIGWMLGTGFEFKLIERPERAANLKKALDDFWTWQKVTKTFIAEDEGEIYDLLEISKCSFIDKDDLPTIDNYYEGRVMTKKYREAVRRGNVFIWWWRIAFTTKWTEQIWAQLIEACNKHDCMWFIEKFIEGDLTKFQGKMLEMINEAFFPDGKVISAQKILDEWL